ncbi:PREDICTED: eukaryotic translation initiation factor 4B3 [Tarenaya hassleriana]|uniref:eukaryotic translation initiation factor 4B3 n=1 Tax=Tarenaya hassleriana TaxID=28532 RepID=UPI00053C7FEC|nr:PREDICTED: eukaryotic translation initiation factor 4B3 [Tarenaya hassleriana]
MAAVVSSAWGKPGSWALEAEEHEAELQQQAPPLKQGSAADDSADFPSLATAAAAAATKTKKKKGQTISLAEFNAFGSAKAAAPSPQAERLTPDELISLPTGPRERSAEELDRSKLGGGFRSYGSGSRYGDESSNSRWGSRVSEEGGRRGGGFNKESSRDFAPSRADETDNWAAAKKPIGNGFERRERGGFFESQSKADEADSWVTSKPSEPRRFGSSNGGNRFESRGSFDSLSRNRESDADSWGRKREETGGSRPRLVLQPRSLPVTNGKPDDPVTVEKPKGGNPFGNARPREEVLAEKGKDWKEIDEKLEAVKLKDVAAEKPGEGPVGRRGFDIGNGLQDARTERSWRKSVVNSEEAAAAQEEPEEEEPTAAADETKQETD